MITQAAISTSSIVEDDHFPEFLSAVRATFSAGTGPLFTTDAVDLFELFLDELPQRLRQHYTCRCCRLFIERYGGLVRISEAGATASAMWSPASVPLLFADAVEALERVVSRAKVTGVFISDARVWGIPESPTDKLGRLWMHFAVAPPAELVYPGTVLKTAEQAAAEKLEEHGMLARGLVEFSLATVVTAHGYLTSGQLCRSEKCEAVVKWLLALHWTLAATKNARSRDNLIWRAAATGPVGFCHIRSGMIGTLLEDIIAKCPFDAVKRRWDEKMSPLQYQRPQAAPPAGNIARAEKIIAALDSSGALERRFARLSDIKPLWMPRHSEVRKAEGLFGHLLPKSTGAAPGEMPSLTMTWEKFARTVLPTAESIEFCVPHGTASYSALVTAVNADAPPILQWDTLEQRNPVSWYCYQQGSSPSAWNLRAGEWAKVTAVTFQPSMWAGNIAHQGESVLFLLNDCRDVRNAAGLAIFPETLKSEYREIRATIEAHSRSGKLQGQMEAEACGIRLQKDDPFNQCFRVTGNGMRTIYVLDRWD